MLFRRLKFLAWLAAILIVVFGGCYLFAPQWLMRADVAREAMAAHVNTHSVQVGDTRWSYYEGGEGTTTLVLLHGFGANKDVWLPMAKALTPHFRVIIPDLPGWGESTRETNASYNIDAQATRLDGFIQALRLPRVLLVGHSMGGAIAGVYAASHSDRVGGLALIDTFGLKMNENTVSRDAMAGRNPFVFDDRAGFAKAMSLVFEQPLDLPGRFVDVLVKRNQADRAFIEHTFNELRDPSQYLSLQNKLDQLPMPVLGLWCQADKVSDISALESLRNGLTRAAAIDSTILHGCNHMPMVEKPDTTGQILIRFALSH